jgi:hypothetical protein
MEGVTPPVAGTVVIWVGMTIRIAPASTRLRFYWCPGCKGSAAD